MSRAASQIVRGGIGGLVTVGKVLVATAGKILAVTFAILMAIFFIETEIQRLSAIINDLLTLKDRVVALETEIVGLKQTIEEGFGVTNSNLNRNLFLTNAVGLNVATMAQQIDTGLQEVFDTTNAVGTNVSRMAAQLDVGLQQIYDQTRLLETQALTNQTKNEQWQFDNRAAAIATLTVAGVNAPEGMLDKTFKNTGTIQQTLTNVATKTQEGFDNMTQKFKKVGAMIDVGRIIDVITLIGVMHNAAMLSRSLFETLFQVVDNGIDAALNAFNVKGLEDEGVDSRKALTETFDNIGKQIFGVQTWTQLKAKWAAANRIVSTGSTLLWSVRDLMDNTQNLAEIAAENSAKVGNALRRAGQVFDTGAWFPENYNHRTVLHRKITNLNTFLANSTNLAQVFEELTSTTIEIQENLNEIDENNEKFQKSLKEGEKTIREGNKPVKKEEDEAVKKPNEVQSVTSGDLDKASD